MAQIPEETQIRIIVDKGKSISCPLCHLRIDAGMGHLCRESDDGVLSGQTWRLSGGQQIHASGAHGRPQGVSGERGRTRREDVWAQDHNIEIAQLRAVIELAYAAQIHPFQTDETRDYCQCGYYKTHPIHTLAAPAHPGTHGTGKS
jgi:hypothetical protein